MSDVNKEIPVYRDGKLVGYADVTITDGKLPIKAELHLKDGFEKQVYPEDYSDGVFGVPRMFSVYNALKNIKLYGNDRRYFEEMPHPPLPLVQAEFILPADIANGVKEAQLDQKKIEEYSRKIAEKVERICLNIGVPPRVCVGEHLDAINEIERQAQERWKHHLDGYSDVKPDVVVEGDK